MQEDRAEIGSFFDRVALHFDNDPNNARSAWRGQLGNGTYLRLYDHIRGSIHALDGEAHFTTFWFQSILYDHHYYLPTRIQRAIWSWFESISSVDLSPLSILIAHGSANFHSIQNPLSSPFIQPNSDIFTYAEIYDSQYAPNVFTTYIINYHAIFSTYITFFRL